MKTAAEIAELIQDMMSSSPGISELTVDGMHIKIDQTSLDRWERRAGRESIPKTRPSVGQIVTNHEPG